MQAEVSEEPVSHVPEKVELLWYEPLDPGLAEQALLGGTLGQVS
jgi:hypothetical protein